VDNPIHTNFKFTPAPVLIDLARKGHSGAIDALRKRGIRLPKLEISELYQHIDSASRQAPGNKRFKHYTHRGYQIRLYHDGSVNIHSPFGSKVKTNDDVSSISKAVNFINTKKFKSSKDHRFVREENDLEIGTDKLVRDRREKTPGENPNKPIPFSKFLLKFIDLEKRI